MRLQRAKRKRKGFTLVELLVVISIISILAALILPGVNSARRAALRAQCLNNMKNIGTAFQNYLSRKGTFPANGYWDAPSDPNNPASPPTEASLVATWNASPMALAIDPNDINPKHSWVLDLLPDLDADNAYSDWDFSQAGGFGAFQNTSSGKLPSVSGELRGNSFIANKQISKVLVCPVDQTATPGQGNLSYVVNGGFAPHWAFGLSNALQLTQLNVNDAAERRRSENLFNMGLMFLDTYQQSGNVRVHRRHKNTMKDGATNTVLFSENINAGVHFAYGIQSNWACPHPFNTSFFINGLPVGVIDTGSQGYNYNMAKTNASQAPPVDPTGLGGGINGDLTGQMDGMFPYPTSNHSGGVHIAMCDSSATFISESIDARVWARLVTPQGSLIVQPSTGMPLVETDEGIGFKQLPDVGNF